MKVQKVLFYPPFLRELKMTKTLGPKKVMLINKKISVHEGMLFIRIKHIST